MDVCTVLLFGMGVWCVHLQLQKPTVGHSPYSISEDFGGYISPKQVISSGSVNGIGPSTDKTGPGDLVIP